MIERINNMSNRRKLTVIFVAFALSFAISNTIANATYEECSQACSKIDMNLWNKTCNGNTLEYSLTITASSSDVAVDSGDCICNIDRHCTYGCDSKAFECTPPVINQYIIFGAIIFFIFGGYIVIRKFK